MGMGRVGRTDRVDNGQSFFIPQIFQRFQRRMQAEESIEINSSFIIASGRFRNCQLRTQMIIIRITVRDDGIQAVHAAALKDDHQ